jgi:hypothetical protein
MNYHSSVDICLLSYGAFGCLALLDFVHVLHTHVCYCAFQYVCLRECIMFRCITIAIVFVLCLHTILHTSFHFHLSFRRVFQNCLLLQDLRVHRLHFRTVLQVIFPTSSISCMVQLVFATSVLCINSSHFSRASTLHESCQHSGVLCHSRRVYVFVHCISVIALITCIFFRRSSSPRSFQVATLPTCPELECGLRLICVGGGVCDRWSRATSLPFLLSLGRSLVNIVITLGLPNVRN